MIVPGDSHSVHELHEVCTQNAADLVPYKAPASLESEKLKNAFLLLPPEQLGFLSAQMKIALTFTTHT